MHSNHTPSHKQLLFSSIAYGCRQLVRPTKANLYLWVGIFLLFFTRIVASILTFDMGPYADEDNYASRGVAFFNILLPPTGSSSPTDWDQFYYRGYWPPLFSIILGPVYASLEYSGVRCFLTGLDIVTGLLFYTLAKRILTPMAALIALYLYTFNPFLWVASFSILSEGMFNFFVIGFLLTFLHLAKSNIQRKSHFIGLTLALGLWMAAAILTRSAFLLVFIVLAPVVLVIFWKNWNKLAIFSAASILMLAMTIPWNMLIQKQEGRFMFMHTISAQQFYMKFVDRSGGWNTVAEKLKQLSTENNTTPQELAKEKTASYFKNLESIWVPVGVMFRDFRNDYLMGQAEHEQRLRLGLYDSTNGKDKFLWAILISHELIRLPLLILGGAGLLFCLGQFKYRSIFIAAALGTASVGIIGLTWGRHLVNLMPFLILGAAAALAELKKIPKMYGLFGVLSLFGVSFFGFSQWQSKSSGYWTPIYDKYLHSINKPYTVSTQLQLRRVDGCSDKLFLDPNENSWNVSVRSVRNQSAAAVEIQPSQEILIDDYVIVDASPKALNSNTTTIKYIANGAHGEIPLNTGRIIPDWSQTIEHSCVKMRL